MTVISPIYHFVLIKLTFILNHFFILPYSASLCKICNVKNSHQSRIIQSWSRWLVFILYSVRFFSKRQESLTMSRIPKVAFQPSFSFALVTSA